MTIKKTYLKKAIGSKIFFKKGVKNTSQKNY